MFKQYFFQLISFLVAAVSYGQSFTSTIDSLQHELRMVTDISKKIGLLNEISYNYRRISPDSVIKFGQMAVQLSKKYGNEKGLAIAYKNIGIGHYKLAVEGDSSAYYYNLAIPHAIISEDFQTQAACLNNLALLKIRSLEFHRAVSLLIEALDVYEHHIPNENVLKSLITANLGSCFLRLGETEKAIEYFSTAIEMAKKLKAIYVFSIFINDMAIANMSLGKYDEAIKVLDEYGYIPDSINDLESKTEVLLAYSQIEVKRKNYKIAEQKAIEAYKIANENGFEYRTAHALSHIVAAYCAEEKWELALENGIFALQKSKEVHSTTLEREILENLMLVYQNLGQFENAYNTTKDYIAVCKSMNDTDTQRFATEMEAKYQNKSKLAKISLLEKDTQTQKRHNDLLKAFLSICALLLLFASYLYFINIKKSKKLNESYSILEETNQALENAKEKLDLKNAELSQYIESNMQLENFAHLASHDLREPLRSIRSFSQLLEKSADSKIDANEKEYLKFISLSSKRINDLVSDLLAYSRIQNEGIHFEKFSLKQLLNQVLQELGAVIEEKQASIELISIPDEIIGSKNRIHQLFSNLISNAIKFVPEERKPKISITGKENGGEFFFAVKDNGIGIPETFKDKIFLLFRRLNNTETFPGTGIGLAICKKVVEQHNGKIWVDSVEGHGSTFLFTLNKNLQFVNGFDYQNKKMNGVAN